MRKKSHISLAKFMVESVDESWLQYHRKAFYIGSVLPDCKPSFITKRHEFEATFEQVGESIRLLTEECDPLAKEGVRFWRDLGEVLHYVADYFTYPHNEDYPGNLREHCAYEKDLKHYLKEYIASGKAALQVVSDCVFESVDALLDFIREAHEAYTLRAHSVEEDARCIIHLCQQVLTGIVQLFDRRVVAEA